VGYGQTTEPFREPFVMEKIVTRSQIRVYSAPANEKFRLSRAGFSPTLPSRKHRIVSGDPK
jgi:hypothetical protein